MIDKRTAKRVEDDHREGSREKKKVTDCLDNTEGTAKTEKSEQLKRIDLEYVYGVCVGWTCNILARKCSNYYYNSGLGGRKLACSLYFVSYSK